MEGAIKLAKLYTKKNGFIVAVKAFHGKTMGSLSMMGKADYRKPPGMLYGGPVYHVPYGDADAVESSSTSARRSASTSPRSSWSRSRARPGRSCPRTTSGRGSAR